MRTGIETPPPAAEPPRPPYAVMCHCAACIVAAVCAWRMYSHTVNVTVDDAHALIGAGRWRYVRVYGRVGRKISPCVRLEPAYGRDPVPVRLLPPAGQHRQLSVLLGVGAERPSASGAHFEGRLCIVDAVTGASEGLWAIDTAASRLHPASVGAMVVAAAGVVLLAAVLRQWVRERRGFACPKPEH